MIVQTSKKAAAIVLTAELQVVAVNSLEAFAKAEKGSRKTIDNMSAHVLTIAKAAESAKGDTAALFKEMCKHAERVYVENHGETDDNGKDLPLSKLVPSWKVYKAQVMAGLKAKLKPSDYKTVYDLQKATPTAKRSAQTPGDSDSGVNVDGTSRVTEAVSKAMRALLDTIAKCPPEHEASVIAALDKARETLEEIVGIESNANAASVPNANVRPAAVA